MSDVDKYRREADPTTPGKDLSSVALEAIQQLFRRLRKRPCWLDVIKSSPPLIIGGQGGSATRLIARILAEGSSVNLTAYDETTYDSWSMRKSGLNNPALISDILSSARSLDYQLEEFNEDLRAELFARGHDLIREVNNEGRVKNSGLSWGWKEPRSMYYLPLWKWLFPDGYKFIHVVRDVRGIRSLHIEGDPMVQDSYLVDPPENARERFELFWAGSNIELHQWAMKNIPNNYYLLNVEKIVAGSAVQSDEINRLSQFVGREIEIDVVKNVARPLRDYSRDARSGLVAEALQLFGYI